MSFFSSPHHSPWLNSKMIFWPTARWNQTEIITDSSWFWWLSFIIVFSNFELTLFPHKKKNNKKEKNPHQNLPEGSYFQVRNFAHGLNLMEGEPQWKRTFDGRRLWIEDNLWWKSTFDERQPLKDSRTPIYIIKKRIN